MRGDAIQLCGTGGELCSDCSSQGACSAGQCVRPADGGSDAGTPDAGRPDAGTPDAGAPDAGRPDAGTGDAGLPDAGTPDAGHPPATGESCADPIRLQWNAGRASAAGDTSGHGDELAGPCGGAGGEDLVYQLDSSSGQDVMVTLLPLSSTSQPVLYLRQSCGTNSAGVCSVAGSRAGSNTVLLSRASAGTWSAVVDGEPGGAGPFELSAAQGVGLGENCGSPLPLVFSGDEANVSVSAPSGSFTNDSAGSCGGSDRGDMVYRFTTTERRNLDVVATTSSGYGAMYLRTRCGTEELACVADPYSNNRMSMRRGNLAPGTYYLWVDGYASHKLYAHLTPLAEGDTCDNPKPLVFPSGAAGGTVTVTGDTTGLFDDASGTCGSSSRPDVVYRFTTDRELDLRASSTAASRDYTVLYLRQGDCRGAQVACGNTGNNGPLAVGGLPPGTYYLWYENYSSTPSPYTLTASLTPPAQGDSCVAPEPLQFTNGTLGGDVTLTRSFATAFSNTTGSCGGSHEDRVFTFTTTVELDLQATAAPTTFGYYNTVVYLRGASCGGAELSCVQSAAQAGPASLRVTRLPPGTYHLFVDAEDYRATNEFQLAVSLTPPEPGERCDAPRPLVFSNGPAGGTASVTSDTSFFLHDSAGTCGGSGADDQVYSFTTDRPLAFTATATASTGGFQPVLYLRGACDSAEQACGSAPASGGPASLNVASLPAGTWYLWVDGLAGSSGAYTLAAELR